MRVLLVHNRYQQRGGEDVAIELERDLLAIAGVEVTLCDVSNGDIVGLPAKLRAAVEVGYSRSGRDWMRQRIAQTRPDIVHVHNFFPRLTPSIYDACRDAGVPVVQTLHNYRIACAAASFLRDGEICEKCLCGSPYWAVAHRCYRGSALGSLALAHMIDRHRRQGTWSSKVDLYFALTEFARSKFVAAGLPPERIVVKPNTAVDPGPPDARIERRGALFVGRLASEKGLSLLLEAWRSLDYPLRIVGDGPLSATVAAAASETITVRGPLDAAAVRREMRRAAFLVVPSTWYEGFPMVIAEAYASGLPVVASRIGSLAEVVEDRVTGRHFAPGHAAELAAVARELTCEPDRLAEYGRQARAAYDGRYSAAAVTRILLDAYATLLSRPLAARPAEVGP